MECSRIDEDLHPFLFMGCWNTVGPGRDAVFTALAANPIHNLVLAGDNVYPLDGDGKKHRVQTFVEGLNKLKESKTIILSALGNHNIVENDKVIFDVGHEGTSLEAVQRAAFGMPAAGPRYFCKRFNDAAIIVLDTNIAEDLAAMEIMADALAAAVASLDVPYYIVQHEPFAAFKKPGKNHVLANSERILRILANNKPIAVLCADTHNYQEGFLHVAVDGAGAAAAAAAGDVRVEVIKQIVVGTGGASPDQYPVMAEFPNIQIKGEEIYYTIDREISVTNRGFYGFYKRTSLAEGKFVSSDFPWPSAGGSRQRRGTRRRGTRRHRGTRRRGTRRHRGTRRRGTRRHRGTRRRRIHKK